MLVYGELYDILSELGASRVYIVQPHPLGHEELLTIGFEVKKRNRSYERKSSRYEN